MEKHLFEIQSFSLAKATVMIAGVLPCITEIKNGGNEKTSILHIASSSCLNQST